MNPVPEPLRSAFKDVRSKHFPKDQIILYRGDEAYEAIMIRSGIVKMYDMDDQGNEKVLHLLKSPAIIPFAFYSGDDQHIRWFYSALTDCVVDVMAAKNLRAQMHVQNQLSTYLMYSFSAEVHELLVRLSSLGKSNAREKLMAALRFLAEYHTVRRRSGWQRVTFPVNHQLLADMTGLTRESAAMMMKSLQEDNIVRNPRMTILEISENLNKSYVDLVRSA